VCVPIINVCFTICRTQMEKEKTSLKYSSHRPSIPVWRCHCSWRFPALVLDNDRRHSIRGCGWWTSATLYMTVTVCVRDTVSDQWPWTYVVSTMDPLYTSGVRVSTTAVSHAPRAAADNEVCLTLSYFTVRRRRTPIWSLHYTRQFTRSRSY